MHPFPEDRTQAICLAKKYAEELPLFLDTETTGLSDHHEVCDIAIIDVAGTVLMNSLVKPVKQQIERQACEIHGISPQMVEHAPTMRDLLPEMERVLRGRTVLVYNLEFDQGKIFRSLYNNGIGMISARSAILANPPEIAIASWWDTDLDYGQPGNWHCAMNLYAQYFGAWNEHHGSYRWQRLSTALEQCGLELPTDMHRALPDAEMTRRLLLHMAAQPIDEQLPMFGEEQRDGE